MNNQLTAPAILGLFDTTKQQRESFADQVVTQVLDGYLDPLAVKIQIKCMEDILAKISDHPQFKEAVTEAAAKYGKGKHDLHNASIEVNATAGRYDYSDDTEHTRLKGQIKARETFLKNLPEPMDYVTGEGEVCKVYPAKYTPGVETVFVSLK
jgi:hypothetical protein